ncbi:MAG: lipoyl synthase [Planctomycetes bacterium]|nr:lipoyl synthase [Planctomycetota bacterium]
MSNCSNNEKLDRERWEREGSSGRPPWLKVRIPVNQDRKVNACLSDLALGTVCQSARCPNQLECYNKGRATFLLMGPSCTRNCAYCAVSHEKPAPLDKDEPRRVAEAVERLQLRHAVITSVTRDDLIDGGAEHFAETVRLVRAKCPSTTIEILVPDFGGDEEAWAIAADSEPDVFNHNIETVPRLFGKVRPGADYDMSLALLDFVNERKPKLATKSGLMVGLGEEISEVVEVGEDLRGVGVNMITVGQYLCPENSKNIPVARYVTPEEFDGLRDELFGIGFEFVACAPFVRSSYNAEEALEAMENSD